MAIWEKWIKPRPFRDVQGSHLKIGDLVWRVEYSHLTLGVLAKISENGTLCINTAIPSSHWRIEKDTLFSKGYVYDEEFLENRKVFIENGKLNSWDSSKLIKVNERSLSKFQIEIVERLKNSL